MRTAWHGDWYERVKQRVKERGFDTATAFAELQPATSLIDLADDLGKDDVAAVQLEKVLIDEAEESRTLERCARSLLVRRLHEELPEGWHVEWDDPSWSRASSAYGLWGAALGERYEPSSCRVWDHLEQASIPEGWLPDGPDDPILLEAFRHWNASGEDAVQCSPSRG